MPRLKLLSVFVVLAAFPSFAFAAVNVGTGNIPGGWVRRLAQSPTDAKTMYCTSWMVHKSTDGGRTWVSRPYPLPSGVDQSQFARHTSYDLAVCPNDQNTVIVGDQNETSIWRTVDGGDTWTAVTLESDSERRMVTMVNFSLSDPNRCFAAGRINPNVNDVRDQYLYISTDKGASWTKTSLKASKDQTIMDAIQLPSGRILVAVADRYYAFIGDGNMATSGSVYASLDNGSSFSQASTTSGWAPYKFVWDSTNNKVWAVGSGGWIYSSSDGNTWTQEKQMTTASGGSGSGPIFFHKIYYKVVGGTPALYATTSGYGAASQLVYRNMTPGFLSTGWQASNYPTTTGAGVDGLVYDIAVDTTDASGASWGIASSVGGYYITTDTFSHVTQSTGINTREVRYGVRGGDRIFVNAFDNQIYGSTDGAKTWSLVYRPMNAGQGYITLHPTDTTRVYLTDGANVRVSTTSGTGSFEMLSLLPPPTPMGGIAKQLCNLIIHPSTPTVMFVGIGTSKGSPAANYLCKSTDGGKTWSSVPGLTTHGINLLAFDPKNPDVIYASGGSGWGTRPFNGDADGLWKSTDAAVTWTKLGAGLLDRGYLETITFDPDNTDLFWTGGVYSDSGSGSMDSVHVSTDGGKNFKVQLMNSNNIGTSKIFYFKPFLYFGTSEGFLYKSDDKGQSWGIAMMFPAMVEWLVDDSTSTSGSSAIRRAPSSTGALYAGSAAGMYRVTGLGAASGITGGYGMPLTNTGGIGSGDDQKAFSGGEPKLYTWPNPFNPKMGSMMIRLGLAQNATSVNVKVYSLAGDLLVDSDIPGQQAGSTYHGWLWNGRNQNGEICAPGLYFVIADVDGTKLRQKVLIKY